MSIAADLAAVVQVPSITGDEKAVLERFAAIAEDAGLHADLHQHNLAALRAHPGHPGEEAPRDELWGLSVTRPGGPRRVCICAHVDVVPPRLRDVVRLHRRRRYNCRRQRTRFDSWPRQRSYGHAAWALQDDRSRVLVAPQQTREQPGPQRVGSEP